MGPDLWTANRPPPTFPDGSLVDALAASDGAPLPDPPELPESELQQLALFARGFVQRNGHDLTDTMLNMTRRPLP